MTYDKEHFDYAKFKAAIKASGHETAALSLDMGWKSDTLRTKMSRGELKGIEVIYICHKCGLNEKDFEITAKPVTLPEESEKQPEVTADMWNSMVAVLNKINKTLTSIEERVTLAQRNVAGMQDLTRATNGIVTNMRPEVNTICQRMAKIEGKVAEIQGDVVKIRINSK